MTSSVKLSEVCEVLSSFLKNYEEFLPSTGFVVKEGEVFKVDGLRRKDANEVICKNANEVIEALPRHMKLELKKRLKQRRKDSVESEKSSVAA